MAAPLLLGIDAGTTRVKAVALDVAGRLLGAAERPAPITRPRPGWVETAAEEILAACLSAADEALARAATSTGASPAAVGIANQRSTTVLWDRATGRPVAPAISWRCGRASDLVQEIAPRVEGAFPGRTGLPLMRYWFAPKAAWLLAHVPGARPAAADGRWAVGTLDAFLSARLTGGATVVTDVSNAARSGLVDLATLDWAPDLLDAFGIPRAALPDVIASAARRGVAPIGGARVPLTAAAGDAGAALLGLSPAALEAGAGKVTIGTGAFLHVATAGRPAASNGLFAAPAYDLGSQGGVRWAIEASIPSAGAGVEWVRRLTGTGPEGSRLGGDAVLVPAFTGLGAPSWDDRLRTGLVGFDEAADAAALAGAALEAVAHQVADAFEALSAVGPAPRRLIADGGLAAHAGLLSLLADLTGVDVVPAAETDAAARGAALLAGIGAGLVEAAAIPPAALGAAIRPTADGRARAAERRARWLDAVQRLRDG